jgi:hypothetical protein
MIHHRQRLSFRLEAGNDAFGIHPWLHNFERHPPAHRLLLFRHEYHAPATFAYLLQQLIAAYPVAGFFADGRKTGISRPSAGRGTIQEVIGAVVCFEQCLYFAQQEFIPGAQLPDKNILLRLRHIECRGEDLKIVHERVRAEINSIVAGRNAPNREAKSDPEKSQKLFNCGQPFGEGDDLTPF